MNPCKECPWSRKTRPGALGGSPAEVYVGQVVLPFWLPCHSSANYRGKASDVNEVTQCVGAATFRTHLGLTHPQIPDALMLLPANHERVFSNLAEFYAHHKKISLAQAHEILTPAMVMGLVRREMSDPKVRMQLKRREQTDPAPASPT